MDSEEVEVAAAVAEEHEVSASGGRRVSLGRSWALAFSRGASGVRERPHCIDAVQLTRVPPCRCSVCFTGDHHCCR